MIYIDHKDFEKVSSPVLKLVANTIKDLIGPTEKAIVRDRTVSLAKSRIENEVDDRPRIKKYAKLQPMPKIDKSGLAMAKKPALEDSESNSMRRAIERSKNPKKVLTEVRKSTEPIYAGGNTAENMRGVMRAENKDFRDKMKKGFSKNPKVYKNHFVNR